MEKEVLDFLHQTVEIAVRLVTQSREYVVNHLFEAEFELWSE